MTGMGASSDAEDRARGANIKSQRRQAGMPGSLNETGLRNIR
jgi:hypothetical protein